MSSLLLLVVCLAVGIALQGVPTVPYNAALALNQFIIHVSLPAVGLYFMPDIVLSRALLFPVGVAWIGFLGSALFFLLLQRIFRWPDRLTGCLIVVAGLGNTSFIGFPVVEAIYGKEGLKTAILVDQPGSFLVLSTLGIGVSAWFSHGGARMGDIFRKIVRFPPFITFVVAIGMNLCGLHFPDFAKDMLWRVGSTVTPIALVSVGLQLKIERRSEHWSFLGLGLLYKLLLLPAVIYTLYVLVLKRTGPIIGVSVIESAMAPMITGAIVAASYGLKPKLANMMIGFGIPLSFVTLWLWWWLVR